MGNSPPTFVPRMALMKLPSASNRWTRLLNVSATKIEPSGATASACGSLNSPGALPGMSEPILRTSFHSRSTRITFDLPLSMIQNPPSPDRLMSKGLVKRP